MNADKQSRGRLVLAGVCLAAALFTGATLAAPLLEARGHGAGPLARAAFFPLCHQIPERSLFVDGHALAVCARCFGLYSGGVLGLLAVALGLRRPSPSLGRWILIALIPTVIDALLPRVGLPQLPNLPRMLLALPGGVVLALHLGWAIADWRGSRLSRDSNLRMSTTMTTPALEEANE